MKVSVDSYIAKEEQWQEEIISLRNILLGSQLAEDIKWGKPCYSFEGKNVAIIQAFKSYFALMFFKGGIMKDPQNLLLKMGENTHAGRQIRFGSVQDILSKKRLIQEFISEAIEIEKRGEKVEIRKEAVLIPIEFQTKLDENPELKSAFESLTPGRQRAYLIHFSAPKKSETKEARILKAIPNILAKKGMDD